MLNIERLSFSYRGQPVIQDISLQVAAGEILGLLGPNGAGKTTLAALITGLLTPAAGQITLDGTPLRLGDTRVALVPQEYAFYPRLTGRENLAYFAGVQALAGTAAQQAIDQALEQCDLTAAQHRRAGHYSGGLKRRLNFAIALLRRPQLLIVDEPTANVDPQTRRLLLDNIHALNHAGSAVIYTSHLLGEVEALCHRVALLDQGQLLLWDTLDNVLREEHRHLEVKCTEPPPVEVCQRLGGRALEDRWWQFPLAQGQSPIAVLTALEAAGCTYQQLRYGAQPLEALYLATLSGKAVHP